MSNQPKLIERYPGEHADLAGQRRLDAIATGIGADPARYARVTAPALISRLAAR